MPDDNAERGQEAMREKRPQPGERYRHFKDKLYQIITVAIHSETQEELVIYQALYGGFAIYAEPLVLFMGEVDHKKYPDVQQKYRFERVEYKVEMSDSVENGTVKTDCSRRNRQWETENSVGRPAQKSDFISKSAPDRTQVLIDFLDCESYEEKLEYLRNMKKYIDDRMMNDISFALDIVIEEGELEDRIRTLENCLKTFCRYEGRNRLR